ncbi:MAG: ribosomal protein S18-alanine N-acetyltransferase [Hyphomicrobiaceae bacterium]
MTPLADNSHGVTIVRAEPHHAASMAPLHARLFDDAWSQATIAGLISRAGALTFVAVDARADTVHGFVIAQVAADEAEILSIGVVPQAQQRGVAGALLTAMLEACTAARVTALFLEVAEDNIAARALYQRHGFAIVGRRRGYYRRANAAVDALLMRRDLVFSATQPAR